MREYKAAKVAVLECSEFKIKPKLFLHKAREFALKSRPSLIQSLIL